MIHEIPPSIHDIGIKVSKLWCNQMGVKSKATSVPKSLTPSIPFDIDGKGMEAVEFSLGFNGSRLEWLPD